MARSSRPPIGRRHLLALTALLVVPTAASVADHPLAAHDAPTLHADTSAGLVGSPDTDPITTAPLTAPAGVTETTLAQAGETIWSIADRVGVAPGALLRHNRPSTPERSGATAAAAARPADRLAAGERLERAEVILVPVRSAGDGAAPSAAADTPAPHPVVADPDRAALEPTFDRWADHFGVPRDLLKALAWVESGWDNASRSATGGVGIGRLQPVRAQYLADHVADMALDPAVAVDNIALTAAQLRVLLDETPDVAERDRRAPPGGHRHPSRRCRPYARWVRRGSPRGPRTVRMTRPRVARTNNRRSVPPRS